MLTFKQFLLHEAVGSSSLYHALSVDHAVDDIIHDRLYGDTVQRYTISNRVKDYDSIHKSDHDYEFVKKWNKKYEPEVRYMQGISMTRNPRFASAWQNVIFEFDWIRLKTKYRIEPFKFFQASSSHMNEYEEFVVLKDGMTENQVSSKSSLYLKNMDRYLIGIYLNDSFMNRIASHPNYLGGMTQEKEYTQIINHPKFKGSLNSFRMVSTQYTTKVYKG